MKNFVLLYRGGGIPKNEKEGQKVMKAWGDWFTKLGSVVVNAGNPFGAAVTVAKTRTKNGAGRRPINGYSIVIAEDIKAATKLTKGCPILKWEDGEVEVHEVMPM
jgi:hypothetical protein